MAERGVRSVRLERFGTLALQVLFRLSFPGP